MQVEATRAAICDDISRNGIDEGVLFERETTS